LSLGTLDEKMVLERYLFCTGSPAKRIRPGISCRARPHNITEATEEGCFCCCCTERERSLAGKQKERENAGRERRKMGELLPATVAQMSLIVNSLLLLMRNVLT
jgi:hypothetical protein